MGSRYIYICFFFEFLFVDVCCGGDFGAKMRHSTVKMDDGFVLEELEIWIQAKSRAKTTLRKGVV